MLLWYICGKQSAIEKAQHTWREENSTKRCGDCSARLADGRTDWLTDRLTTAPMHSVAAGPASGSGGPPLHGRADRVTVWSAGRVDEGWRYGATSLEASWAGARRWLSDDHRGRRRSPWRCLLGSASVGRPVPAAVAAVAATTAAADRRRRELVWGRKRRRRRRPPGGRQTGRFDHFTLWQHSKPANYIDTLTYASSALRTVTGLLLVA